MELTELDTPLVSEEFSIDTHDRSPGLHLSDITAAMDRAYGKKYADNWGDKQALFTMGFLWERFLTRVMLGARFEKGLLISAGEHEMDGVFITPDGLNIDDWTLEEWKCTWQSMSKDPMEFYRYWRQIKAGCRALGTNEALLRVLFTQGDYKGSGPRNKTWRAKFTDREIEENWSQILAFAEKEEML